MNLADIRNLNVGTFEDLATSLSTRVTSIEEARGQFGKITEFPGWSGAARDAAKQNFQNTDKSLLDDVARISAVREMAAELKADFTQLQSELKALEREADALGASIDDSGFVQDKPDAEITDAQRARIGELSAETEELIRAADRLDQKAADVLKRAMSGEITAGGATTDEQAASSGANLGQIGVTEPPPDTAEPPYNTGWWNSMTTAQQQWVIANHPDWIGNRNGVSGTARDKANQELLPLERDRLVAERDRLQKELDDNPFGGAFNDKDAELWYVNKKLEDLNAIEKTLKDHPERKLLLLDMKSAERGKAAIADGDVDTADHISVAAPGLNSNVGASIGGMADEAHDLKRETERILDTQHKPNETVATVAWIGYQCPQTDGPGGLTDVARGGYDVSHDTLAKSGAQDLSRFYQGLGSAWHPAPGDTATGPQITALGHSYGSLTTSLALQQTPPGVVASAMFYGSPGIAADSAEQLHLGAGHVFAMRADQDWIGIPAGTGNFGADPAVQPWVTRLSTHDGVTYGDSVDGRGVFHEGDNQDGWWYVNGEHSQYPQNGSNGELRMPGYNMAAVLAGMAGAEDGRHDVTEHGE